MSADELLNSLRTARDAGIEAWAVVVKEVTSSRPYAQATSALAQPMLIATGILREVREKAAAKLLGQLNLPSRDDVLSLSQRITRMETVLDDVRAAVEGDPAEPEQEIGVRQGMDGARRVRGDA